MATQHHILRLRRTDQPKEHLLVNVSRNGSRFLDLKLVATDQEHLFHRTIKESEVKSLQSSQFTGDLQDWKSTLSYVLLRTRPDGPLSELLRGVEVVASISKQSVSLTIRKNIDGITQKLGVVVLDQDDEREEVAAFDWVDAAVASADELRVQLEALQSSLVSQQDQITELTTQLDGLTKAKREHEEELLSKFAALLNSKKLKIRDQQRLLSGAKIDPGAARAAQMARSGEGDVIRKPGASRAGKRRAEAAGDEVDPERDQADVGNETGEETDTDTDDGEAQGPETPPQESDGDVERHRGEQGVEPMNIDMDGIKELPPRRELPFKRKPPPKEAPPSFSHTLEAEDDEEEETDDEL